MTSGRPGGNRANPSSSGDQKLSSSMTSRDDTAPGLSQDWQDGFRRGFAVAVEAALAVGYGQGWDAHAELISWQLGVASEFLRNTPTRRELARAREYTNDPCRAKCGRCSKCLHSRSYWSRGGDYLGVAEESRLR
jgi:hypothetical protein